MINGLQTFVEPSAAAAGADVKSEDDGHGDGEEIEAQQGSIRNGVRLAPGGSLSLAPCAMSRSMELQNC